MFLFLSLAIVKKGGIPALAVLPQSDAMLLRNFEKSISVHEKPQLNETGTKTTVAGKIVISSFLEALFVLLSFVN